MAVRYTLQAFAPEQWELYRDLRLSALLESPDAFGSTHALEVARPAEMWRERLTTASSSGSDLPLLASVRDSPAGLCWAKRDALNPSIVNLFQMWVAPEYRCMGIGHALLARSLAWARGLGATQVHLGVTLANAPEHRLYLRTGFLPHGDPEPLRHGSSLHAQKMVLALSNNA